MSIRFALPLATLLLSACSGTLPVTYTPQSFQKVPGLSLTLGEFEYEPSNAGQVASNQIQNTALGIIYIGEDVARYVRRATAIELERAGVIIGQSDSLVLHGKIIEMKLDDLGYSVDWTYIVNYTMIDKSSGQWVFNNTYRAKPRTTGKFGQPSDFTASANLMILDGIEQLMEDLRSRQSG